MHDSSSTPPPRLRALCDFLLLLFLIFQFISEHQAGASPLVAAPPSPTGSSTSFCTLSIQATLNKSPRLSPPTPLRCTLLTHSVSASLSPPSDPRGSF